MAKVLGEAGRYTSDEAARQRTTRLLIGFVLIGLVGVAEGVTLSSLWSKLNPPAWLTSMVQWGGIIVTGVAVKWGFRKLDQLEAERLKWQRGTDGETVVGKILAGFPDGFYVINDLSTPSGNLDHVVVGPTGVFVLDAKNWRGVVQADGQGELLLNDKPTDKDAVRNYTARIMRIKEKVRTLAPGCDPFFRGLFVFTAARVEAAWGKTGPVHCLREDQLWDYIVEKDYGARLKTSEVQEIAQAFLGLAHMDRDFSEKVTAVESGKSVVAGLAQTANA